MVAEMAAAGALPSLLAQADKVNENRDFRVWHLADISIGERVRFA